MQLQTLILRLRQRIQAISFRVIPASLRLIDASGPVRLDDLRISTLFT